MAWSLTSDILQGSILSSRLLNIYLKLRGFVLTFVDQSQYKKVVQLELSEFTNGAELQTSKAERATQQKDVNSG